MIEKISNYASIIICTLMMMMIVKMIIPDGKNKKYILFVCGLIMTLVLFEPLFAFMNIDINEVLAQNQMEYSEYKVDESLYKNAINDSYEKKLVEDIINRLQENGYSVNHVKVEYDEVTYKPKKLYLNLEDEEGYVQPVKIEVSQNHSDLKVNEMTKSKIQEIIKANYGIEKNNVYIERSR